MSLVVLRDRLDIHCLFTFAWFYSGPDAALPTAPGLIPASCHVNGSCRRMRPGARTLEVPLSVPGSSFVSRRCRGPACSALAVHHGLLTHRCPLSVSQQEAWRGRWISTPSPVRGGEHLQLHGHCKGAHHTISILAPPGLSIAEAQQTPRPEGSHGPIQTCTPTAQKSATTPPPANTLATRPVPISGSGFFDLGNLVCQYYNVL